MNPNFIRNTSGQSQSGSVEGTVGFNYCYLTILGTLVHNWLIASNYQVESTTLEQYAPTIVGVADRFAPLAYQRLLGVSSGQGQSVQGSTQANIARAM